MAYKTVQQIAEELQVHEQTIRRKIYSGELNAYKVGSSYRISDEQLKKYLEKEAE